MKKIEIVIDASGSMAEDGKSAALRYLLYAIENIIRDRAQFQAEICFVYWNETVTVFQTSGRVRPDGRLNAAKFREYCKENSRDTLIFLSDGYMDRAEKEALREACIDRYMIGIGMDCNTAALASIASDGQVYKACDIPQLLAVCMTEY